MVCRTFRMACRATGDTSAATPAGGPAVTTDVRIHVTEIGRSPTVIIEEFGSPGSTWIKLRGPS
eukprot:16237648-Heterocapsa_arctica.AAC.1